MLVSICIILFSVARILGANCPAPVPTGCSSCKEEIYNDRSVPIPYCESCNVGYTLNPVFEICDLNCNDSHIVGCTKCSGTQCTGCADVYTLVDGKCIPKECVINNKECNGMGHCEQIGTQLMYRCVCNDPLLNGASNCVECLGGYTLSGSTCNPWPCTGQYTERCSICKKDGSCYLCKEGFFSPDLDCGSPCPIGCDCDPSLNYVKCRACHDGFTLSFKTGLMLCEATTNCTAKPLCMWCDINNACLSCVSGQSNPKSDCSVPCANIRGCSDCSPVDPNICVQCIDSKTTADKCQPRCYPPPSAGSLFACAEVYDIYSSVVPYFSVALKNVRYSIHSYGFVACNKLGYINDLGVCICYNDPLRDPETACVECIFGYMLDRYTQRCLKDTLNSENTHCMVGNLQTNECYTCTDGYYDLASKCSFNCNIENCLRCTDDGKTCVVCVENTVSSNEGICVPTQLLSSHTDNNLTTDEKECDPRCGPPFVCAKGQSGKWICAHPRCVKTQGGEKQICGLKGTCTRAGACICDDPNSWEFCSTCKPGWTRSSTSSTCDIRDCFPSCSNGGVCTITADGESICRCPFNWDPATHCITCLPGYTGRNCNIPYCFINEDCGTGQTCISGKCNDDPCSSNNGLICNGHGTCTVNNNIRQCICNSGYDNETNCLTCTMKYSLNGDKCISKSTSMSPAMIAGLVIGSSILLIAVGLSIYFCVKIFIAKK